MPAKGVNVPARGEYLPTKVKRHSKRDANYFDSAITRFLVLVSLVSGSGTSCFWFWYLLFLVLVPLVSGSGINPFGQHKALLLKKSDAFFYLFSFY